MFDSGKVQKSGPRNSQRGPMPAFMGGRRRIAALEIAEHTCGLLVVEAIHREEPQVLERLVEPVRTGLIGSDGRFVESAALDRLWDTLNRLGGRAGFHAVGELLALATPSLALQEDCLYVMSDGLGARLTLLDDVNRARLNAPLADDLLDKTRPPLLMLDLGSESAGLMVLDEIGEIYGASAWLGRPALLAEAPLFEADGRAAHAQLAVRTRALIQSIVASAMRRRAGQFLMVTSLASTIRRLSWQLGRLRRGTLEPDEIACDTLGYLEEELLAMSPGQRTALTDGKQAAEETLRAILVARTVLGLTGMQTAFLRAPSALDGFMGNYLRMPIAPIPLSYMVE